MRYHLHPLTGQAAPCRAQVRCPFGDLQEDHYDSAEAAQAAYEEKMRALTFLTARLRDPALLPVVEAVEKFVASLPPGEEQHLARRLQEKFLTAPTHLAFDLYRSAVAEGLLPGHSKARRVLDHLAAISSYVESYQSGEEEWLAVGKQAEKELRVLRREGRPPLAPATAPEAWQEEARRERELYDALVAQKEGLKKEHSLEGYRARQEVLLSSLLKLASQPSEQVVAGEDISERTGLPLFRGASAAAYEEQAAPLATVLFPGSGPGEEGSSPEAYGRACEELSSLGLELARRFTQGEGARFPSYGEELPEESGFRLVGRGAERNAYLHGESGMVFKVVHEENTKLRRRFGRGDAAVGGEALATVVELQEEEQRNYAAVDEARLAEHNVAYVPTYFLRARLGEQEVTLLAQPYLDPQRFVPAQGHLLESKLGREAGVTDLNSGNVRYDLATDRLLLLDCIY